MSEDEDIYAATVRLLRDVSRNHAAAAADMCSGAIDEPAGRGLLAPEPNETLEPVTPEIEDLGAMLRELEDVGLGAVSALARASDDRVAFEAIDEADAGWLRAVILNRAAETVGRS
jgi:hypothetical protein